MKEVKTGFLSIPNNVSCRKPKTLKDILVRVRLLKEINVTNKEKGMHKSGKSKCKICEVLKTGNRFSGRLSKVSYLIIILIEIYRVLYIFFSVRCARCNI